MLVAWLAQAPQSDPSMRLGRDALAAGRFDEAIAHYTKALNAQPTNPGIMLNLCIANYSAAHYPQALPWCQKATALPPSALFLGLTHLKLGQPKLALAPLQRFHAAQPTNPTGLLELADTYFVLGQHAQALPLFLKLNTPEAQKGAALSQALIHRNAKRHKDSIAVYRAALQAFPNDARFEQELGRSLYLDHNYDEAIPLLARYHLDLELGISHLDTGDSNAAIAALTRVQDRPEAQAPLGSAYLKSGQPEKAIPHLIAAAKDDTDGSIHLQLARAYQRTGQPQAAAKAQARYEALSKK